MFSFLTSLLPNQHGRPIDMPPVQIHDIETSSDQRARTLKHLIKANHANFSIIYHNLRYHNHLPHSLATAYLFGGTSEHLSRVYDEEARELEAWRDSPGEVGGEDWRDFLGKPEYQRAFVDFFEDQLVQYGYDWEALLKIYLYEGDHPLIHNLICGLAHPLIHLGYGYELSSRTIAIEALAMACCFYNFLHKYLDDDSYSKLPTETLSSSSPLDLLSKILADDRFDLFSHPGSENMKPLFEQQEAAVLQYWNGWTITAPKEQFEESQKAAVALLAGTRESKGRHDFFLVHLLTSSHAVRTLLPHTPAKFQVPLVRQWWLFVVAVYICQQRPRIELKKIEEVDTKGKNWKYVVHMAVAGKHALDAHYVKALRAMREAANTWGDPEQYYLKAAIKFADEFDGWGGFGTDTEAEVGR